MLKKSMGIAVALCMILTVVTGCGGGLGAGAKGTGTESTAAQSKDEAPGEGETQGGGESKPEAETSGQGESGADKTGSEQSVPARPDGYAVKPVELIVPYAAGGAADIVARAIASVLPDYLDGASVTITNVTGGNGVVGVTQLLNEKSDGYTMAIYASPIFEITPFMNDVNYGMDDFTFLGTVVQRPNVMVVNAASPWQTLDEFVEYAKSNPGTTYGDPAAGSAHLGFEALIKAAEITGMKFVPYSGGSGEAITALLGKHVDAVMALPADTYEYIRSGDLRALCIQGDERIDIMPDIPTAKELGYDVTVGLTNGFIAPKGLDPAVSEYLSAALEQAVSDPRVLELDPGDEGLLIYYSGEDTKSLLTNTAASFEGIIKELGLESN